MTKDVRFLQTAVAIADIWSKDPSSKVGCIAVGDSANQVAFGYNGFPPGIQDTPERLADRSQKYSLTIHAEVNALANAKFDVRTLYVTHHPCSACALRILAARTVTRVVFVRNKEFETRWADSIAMSRDLLLEGGVSLEGIAI